MAVIVRTQTISLKSRRLFQNSQNAPRYTNQNESESFKLFNGTRAGAQSDIVSTLSRASESRRRRRTTHLLADPFPRRGPRLSVSENLIKKHARGRLLSRTAPLLSSSPALSFSLFICQNSGSWGCDPLIRRRYTTVNDVTEPTPGGSSQRLPRNQRGRPERGYVPGIAQVRPTCSRNTVGGGTPVGHPSPLIMQE